MNRFIGKTITNIEGIVGDDELRFHLACGSTLTMYHEQTCCESVYVEDICGDLADLIGSPILLSEEISDYDGPPLGLQDDSYTWTFYKLATLKGAVTIRWYGESNGCYSEEVSIREGMLGE